MSAPAPGRRAFHATVLLLAAMVVLACEGESLRQSAPGLLARLPPAIAINGAFAVLAWRARVVTPDGAVAGAVVGILLLGGAGWPGWSMLVAAFVMTTMTTRAGRARKTAAGIAEERKGRRAWGNVAANTGVAAAAAVLAAGTTHDAAATLALAASIVTSVSDTVASETGKAFGRTTRLVTTWRRVPAGTPGAVSVKGTLAGAAAALLLSLFASAVGLMSAGAVPVVAAVAMIASTIEGMIAVGFETRGLIDNDEVNLLNAILGAGLAVGARAAGLV